MIDSPIKTVMEYVTGGSKPAHIPEIKDYRDIARAMMVAQTDFGEYDAALNFVTANISLSPHNDLFIRNLTEHFTEASGLAWNIGVGSMVAYRDKKTLDLGNIASSLANVAPAGLMINLLVQVLIEAGKRTEMNIEEISDRCLTFWKVSRALAPNAYIPTKTALLEITEARYFGENYGLHNVTIPETHYKLLEQIAHSLSRQPILA